MRGLGKVAVVIVCAVAGCSTPDTGGQGDAAKKADTLKKAGVVESTSTAPQISAETKSLVIDTYLQNKAVKRITIEQERAVVRITVYVEPGTTVEDAERHGTNIIRLTKMLSADTDPKQDVGTGIYDYRVMVGYDDVRMFTTGAKNMDEANVKWFRFGPRGR